MRSSPIKDALKLAREALIPLDVEELELAVQRLEKSLRGLPIHNRAAFLLNRANSLRAAEIAGVLEISPEEVTEQVAETLSFLEEIFFTSKNYSSRDSLRASAVWVTRTWVSGLTEGQEREFMEWLCISSDNCQAFLRMQIVWLISATFMSHTTLRSELSRFVQGGVGRRRLLH